MSMQIVLGWTEEEFGFHDIWTVDIAPYSKLIYLFLIDVITLDKGLYPSYTTISRFTNMSRTSAITHVKALEDKGLLIKLNRKVDDINVHTTNQYILLHPKQASSPLKYIKGIFS